MSFISTIELVNCCDIRPINLNNGKYHIDLGENDYSNINFNPKKYPEYNKSFTNINPGDTIYINYNTLINFFLYSFPLIDKPFILVTGFSDKTLGYFSEINQIINLVNHSKLIKWYVQNLGIIHPKIKCLPIGVDLHTLPTPLHTQEEPLHSIPRKHFSERKIKIYSTFQFKTDYSNNLGHQWGDERTVALRDIPSNIVYYEPKRIDRLQSWENQTDYAFVASPYGAGLDCYRTWEALILGCIPIIRVIPSMEPLFDDLPVLIVDNWSDINYKLLKDTVIQFKKKTFNYNKLTLDYWKHIINSTS